MTRHLKLACIIALGLMIGFSAQASNREIIRSETVIRGSAHRLAVGITHSCVLSNDGTARCWGENLSGQLGDGTKTSSAEPVRVSGLTDAVAIDAREEATCAIMADGSARCWGRNTSGMLGDGSTQDRSLPVSVSGLSNAVAITIGQFFACALISDGTVRCWGSNTKGQLGDGTTQEKHTPVMVQGVTNAIAIAAGGEHACAVRYDGSALCWGRNDEGELGNGQTTSQPTTVPVPVSLGALNAVSITAGSEYTFALIADGSAVCWGENGLGELGNGTTASSSTPVPVSSPLANAISIAAGAFHTCAVLASGRAQCWGYNFHGQLGDGTKNDRDKPVAPTGLTNAIAIGAGRDHTCALLGDATARCWGSAAQLGYKAQDDSATPSSSFPVTGVSGSISARHIAGGDSHTCAVRSNGSASCWGLNNSGQVGDNTTFTRTTPTAVKITNAVAVALGLRHSCALTADGTMDCWGDNSSGQLGDGSTTGRAFPSDVFFANNVMGIATGNAHSCALLADGTANCWGNNSVGQLGDGTTTNRSLATTNVTNLTSTNIRAAAITAGDTHTCALRSNGTVLCWGGNAAGQLGDGTKIDRAMPVGVAVPNGFLLSTAVGIAAGGSHTCALNADGGVRCWGANDAGQLGDGTTTSRSKAQNTNISGVESAVAVVAGESHTCALIANGTVRCWGANNDGQLGVGSSTAGSTKPLPVPGIKTAIAIAAGSFHTCAILADGSVQCWGLNKPGQIGDKTTTTRFTPVTVPSFTVNIDPVVELKGKTSVTTVNVIAVCAEDQQLFVDVVLTQGSLSGHGTAHGDCTGALEKYPVTVPSQGRDDFIAGAASVEAVAEIRDRGQIVDHQEWTRNVQIVRAQ